MNTETQYEPHPAAELFPMMPPDQYEAFKEDVRKNGFQQDIVLYKGQILDGRNRYKAAIDLDMLNDLPIAEMDDDTDIDPYQWVISRNLHRRHLTDSQRAAIAARLVTKKRGDNQHTKKEDSSIGECSIAQAADLMQVSPKSVERAKIVIEHGSPELIEAVEQGKVAVSKAAVVARESPKEKQLEMAKPKKTTRQILKREREREKQDREKYERRKQRAKAIFLSLRFDDQATLILELLQGDVRLYLPELRVNCE